MTDVARIPEIDPRPIASPSDAERHERAIPLGYADLGHIARKEPAGSSIYPEPTGTCRSPVYAAPPAAVQEPVAVKALVESLAAYLCDEWDFELNPCVGYSWPEHSNDDGYRGDGYYVKLQPSDVQARARENASRIIAFLSSSVLSTSQSDPAPEIAGKAAEIVMGRGLIDVTSISYDGRSGILFRPRSEHIPVGDEGQLQEGEYWPVAGDVVIWIENDGGAQVIEKYLRPFLPVSSPEIAALRAENERLRKAMPEELTGKLQWAMHDAFLKSKADTLAGQMIDVYDAVRAAVAPEQGEAK
ncbi:hypothetical protein G6L15_06580 [Agrobacterium rhizogenes]|uniref:hypothetical protein n=1 Tax=Rhizobium rhizogenes TaxID=359 RepID=UPI001572C9CC|nr:hypothetical protein [Rhizobium rhizogenes]NTG85814.1 hypothetical protein [Rhizobium rhizogenes]